MGYINSNLDSFTWEIGKMERLMAWELFKVKKTMIYLQDMAFGRMANKLSGSPNQALMKLSGAKIKSFINQMKYNALILIRHRLTIQKE